MKKFWTIVLKVVMFMSFVGIIVFSCIAIISSNNIAYEAYNYVTTHKSTLGLEELSDRVSANIKSSHGAPNDPYASFLSDIILTTKDSLDYYLDFLAVDDTISKGEQNVIIDDFKKCVKAKENCEKSYADYMTAYSNASEGIEYASKLVITCERDFLHKYRTLYDCIATLQLDLYKATKINVVKVESYDFQKMIVRTGLSSGVVEKIFTEENVEKMPEKRIVLGTDSSYTVYRSYCSKMNIFSNQNIANDTNLQKYVDNLNSLDIFMWAKSYDAYSASVNNVLREKASQAKSFFDANLR